MRKTMVVYDIKIYRKDGREGPTIRGLTFAQMMALTQALNEYLVPHSTINYKQEGE